MSRRFSIVAAGALSLTASLAATAAHAQDPRLNGYWAIDADARAAAGLTNPRAVLAPAGQEITNRNAETQRARTARGEVVGLNAFICGRAGVPAVYGTSEPWLLSLTKDEASQVFERREAPPRHFFMDGRTLDGVDKLPPSVNGYSIAHWEGKTLVIETRAMPSGGVTGGALKGPKTLLTEHVSLNDAGNRLTWRYTWTDPELLSQPHSFALEYDRSPKHTFAYTHFCDPAQDASRLVAAPKQD